MRGGLSGRTGGDPTGSRDGKYKGPGVGRGSQDVGDGLEGQEGGKTKARVWLLRQKQWGSSGGLKQESGSDMIIFQRRLL
jgi:hypothetical protein